MAHRLRIACAFVLALALNGCGFDHGTAVEPDAPAESITVGFGDAETTADETSGTVTITVTLSSVSTLPITVDYTVGSGTATRPDDFALADGTLTFMPGQTDQQIEVAITMDAVEEPDETVLVQLADPVGATLGANASHTVTISSDILPRASFVDATSSTANEATSPTIEVQLSVAPPHQVKVEIGVTGTASGADRALTDGTMITFPAGVTSQVVPVGVVQDALDEDDETVVLALQNPSPKLLLAPTNTMRMHTISDDDPLPTVGYAAATSTTGESQSVTLTVQLSAASGRMVSVAYAVTGGTAGVGDATVTPGTVVFMPGQTSRTIAVAVTNDAIDEPSETLIVTLSSPVNATLTAATAHTLTITDDDNPPQAAFAQASASVNEAMTAVSLTVQLSSASGFAITVPFSAAGTSTADNPDDFTFASTSALMIPAGMTSATVVVNVKADTVDEANETVVVDLGTPTNATLGAVARTTLTINDDDPGPTVALTSMGSQASEKNSNITLTVQPSDISGQDVTVPFSIDAASTASNPADYTITASPVVIAAGQTSTTITIAMNEDNDLEADETVIVVLGTPTNATLATPSTYTFTIINDD